MIQYEKYKGMINDLAYHYHLKTGLDYQELKSEANLIFFEAINKYNGTSSFSTFLFFQLRGYLGVFIRKEYRLKQAKKRLSNNHQKYHYDKYESGFKLSDDFKELLSLLLSCSKDMIKFTCNKKRTKPTKNIIYKYLIDKLKWKRIKVIKTFKQIQLYLKEYYI